MDNTQDIAAAGAPMDAVVGLIAVFADGTEQQFSGALISPTEVLTAAHGVYKEGVGQAVEVIALPGGVPADLAAAGNEAVFQTGTYAASVHTNAVPDAGGTLTLVATQSDEAVVGFGIPLAAGPVFALAAGPDSAAVTVAGFPSTAAGHASSASGTVAVVSGATAYSGETGLGPGSSGGPIFTILDGQPTVIGTVSSSLYATQVSPALLSTIRDWQAADTFAALPAGGTTATAPGTAALLRMGDDGTLDSGGNDTVQAGGGTSTIYAAGTGCSVLGGAGTLVVVGGAGSDTVRPGTGTSLLYGGSGGGILEASTGGGSVLVAGSGNTTLVGGGDGDLLFCAPTESGNVAAAGRGAEMIIAGQGATTILGGSGTATVFAGSGTDTFQLWSGLGGTLQIVGFRAGDTLDYSPSNNPVTATTSGAWGTTLSFADGSRAVLFGVAGVHDVAPA
jgi:Ca2+-binding RTX toxin-like protein